jgi:hypothetical protein
VSSSELPTSPCLEEGHAARHDVHPEPDAPRAPRALA